MRLLKGQYREKILNPSVLSMMIIWGFLDVSLTFASFGVLGVRKDF